MLQTFLNGVNGIRIRADSVIFGDFPDADLGLVSWYPKYLHCSKTLPFRHPNPTQSYHHRKGSCRLIVSLRFFHLLLLVLPVGVEHGSSMATEQGHALRELACFVQGDNGESTTTTGLPIDREVFRIDLYRRPLDRHWGETSGAVA